MSEARRKAYIKDIIELIDENENLNVKLSFYSDLTVNNLMKKAYSLWENGGGKGIPLDYLSDEELEELHIRAIHYYQNPIGFSYTDMVKGINIEERKINKEGIGSKFTKVLRRLFFASS
ncbi:MAG: hypothetical protein RQ952_03155 [Thermoproteota archaeon]|jgi:hypothetical protein|nr:hypothetical protein [Thermoproteota archaeon]